MNSVLLTSAIIIVGCTSGGQVSDAGTCSAPDVGACLSCISMQCSANAQTACNAGNAFTNCYCPCTSNGGTALSCAHSCASSSCQNAVVACASQATGAGGACAAACSGSNGDGGGSCSGSVLTCLHPSTDPNSGALCTALGPVPAAAVSETNTICTQASGTPGTHCPTSLLIGCCVDTSTSTCAAESMNCIYGTTANPPTAADVMGAQMACLQGNQQDAGGVVLSWTTTPP